MIINYLHLHEIDLKTLLYYTFLHLLIYIVNGTHANWLSVKQQAYICLFDLNLFFVGWSLALLL